LKTEEEYEPGRYKAIVPPKRGRRLSEQGAPRRSLSEQGAPRRSLSEYGAPRRRLDDHKIHLEDDWRMREYFGDSR